MFMGEFEHSVDAKGRTIVPAKLRDGLGETFVITKGLDNCLWGFDQESFKEFEDKLNTFPMSNVVARNTTRFFLAGATTCDIDKQGRILIPNNLREFANLSKDIVFIGVGKKIEIWDKAKWEAYNNECNQDMNNVIGQLEDLGFSF